MNQQFDSDKLTTQQCKSPSVLINYQKLQSYKCIVVQEIETLRTIYTGPDEFEELIPGKSFILQRVSPSKKGNFPFNN